MDFFKSKKNAFSHTLSKQQLKMPKDGSTHVLIEFLVTEKIGRKQFFSGNFGVKLSSSVIINHLKTILPNS